jgi:hypothetical protein
MPFHMVVLAHGAIGPLDELLPLILEFMFFATLFITWIRAKFIDPEK